MNAMNDIKSHDLNSFAKLFQTIFQKPNSSCIPMDYDSEIKGIQKDDTTLGWYIRPWIYQTCSEFGWYQTTDSKEHPFGSLSPVEFYLKICQDAFGEEV